MPTHRSIALVCLVLLAACLPGEARSQMTSVVNSLADDADAYPWDDPDTPDIDESVDGVCEDLAGRCTFRAALEEAWYIGTSANVTFSVSGEIVVDPSMSGFAVPSGSLINGGSRSVTIRGSNPFSFLLTVDSLTTVKGLVFRNAIDAIDVIGKYNIIGGEYTADGNMFLGIDQSAIMLIGDSNLVTGNRIGIGGSGDAIAVAPNGDTVYNQFGIFVIGSYNIIGDSIGSHRNVISRNSIAISMVGDNSGAFPCIGNQIRGNIIGLAEDGVGRASNGYGIEMLYGGSHFIGGAGGDGFNIISGNRVSGILAGTGTDDVLIAENVIGPNINLDTVGGGNGVTLGPGSFDCQVIGNEIVFNPGYGVEIAGGHAGFNYPSYDHLIAGNSIEHNGLGIIIGSKATGNVIGSSLLQDFQPNTIQRNRLQGVLIASSATTPHEARRNTVRKNSFLSNGGDDLEIRHSQDNIAAPWILSYTRSGAQATVTGIHYTPGSVIDIYHARQVDDTWFEAYNWLGSTKVGSDDRFEVTFDTCACDPIAATATDPLGNTSMISILHEGAEVIIPEVTVYNGWNMLSVPVAPVSGHVDSLFPARISNVFAFTPSGYASTQDLSAGIGYWARFGSAGTQPTAGYALRRDTFAVNAGWNLVGSISDPVPVATVSSVPPGMILSNFFGYAGLYEASDTIHPGSAYWVKVAQAGSLVLDPSAAAPAANRVVIADRGELPPPPPPFPHPQTVAAAAERPASGKPLLLDVRPDGAAEATIRYWNPERGTVTIRAYDRHRRVVATIAEGVVEAGLQTVEWPTSNLAAGSYVVEIAAARGSSVRLYRHTR